SCTGLLNVRPAAVGSKVPPESHSVPLPSGAALPRLSVPPASGVASLTVALLPSTRVPTPPSMVNGPVTAPVTVVALLTVSPLPDNEPENVVTPELESVSVLLPLTLTAPLNVRGVLPPSVTTPLLPPALARLTVLLTVVATPACTVPLSRFSAPVPRPLGLPMVRVPESRVVPPV